MRNSYCLKNMRLVYPHVCYNLTIFTHPHVPWYVFNLLWNFYVEGGKELFHKAVRTLWSISLC